MEFHNPNHDHVEFNEEFGLFKVRVKSKFSWVSTGQIFIMLILTLIAVVQFTNFGIVLFSPFFILLIFLIVIIKISLHIMWNFLGYEVLSQTDTNLTLQRHMSLFRRTWTYDTKHITDVRLDPSGPETSSFFDLFTIKNDFFPIANAGLSKYTAGTRFTDLASNCRKKKREKS